MDLIAAADRAAKTLGPGLRTTTGKSDNVVVVGAGLAGLSAAMRLLGAGRNVTILERDPTPGGRAGVTTLHGASGDYLCDTGPTVLTMPGLIADCFDALGEDMDDWLTMLPVDPLYTARFADGSRLPLHADVGQNVTEISNFAGHAEASRYEELVVYLEKLYRAEIKDFIDSNIDTPWDLLTANLVKLWKLGGFGKLAPAINSRLHDSRLQRLFSFQSLYAGVSPGDALALYAVIAYMDSVAGVFFPEGGMHTIPQAMSDALEKHGATLRYGTTVERVELDGTRATAVITTDGERIPCDAVVLNPDLPVAREQLLRRPLRRPLVYSPSCWLLLAGSTAGYDDLSHHTICFGDAWLEVFEDLNNGRLMRDPSILVSSPTVTDPSLAPAGRHSYYVLLPTPHLDSPVNWDAIGPAYFDHAMQALERHGFTGFADGLEVTDVTTPVDWKNQGMAAGTPFAAAHLFRQTGPFRPPNIWGQNVTFAGSGTVPGVGVPMVLISGRLAAERITGHDPSYSSRAWPENL